MKKILVLLSTYNGERFLREQLDSLVAQNTGRINVDLLVRDDGSSDKTKEILCEYQEALNLKFFFGENLKPAQSYRQLIELAPLGYDAYAYADQDDIWDDIKLQSAMSALEHYTNKPTMWYSGVAAFSEGNDVSASVCPEEKASSLVAVMMTCCSTNGCTMVFNEKLLHALKNCPKGNIDMHDSWTNIVCLAMDGKVLCDQRCLVKYRLHAQQVTGQNNRGIRKAIGRWMHPAKLRSETAKVIVQNDLIKQNNKEILLLFAGYRKLCNKVRLLFLRKPREISSREYIKFWLQVLMNLY